VRYDLIMNHAFLLAAGSGKRSKLPDKLQEMIAGKPLFWHALQALQQHPLIKNLVLVVPDHKKTLFRKLLKEWGMLKIIVAIGGKTRQESAEKGLIELKKNTNIQSRDLLLFHNAANPFLTSSEITQVLKAGAKTGAAFVAHPIVDTVKSLKKPPKRRTDQVIETIDRSNLWQAQTPQVVRMDLYEKALAKNLSGTDEMSLIEQLGIYPRIIKASPYNFKITYQRDFEFARFLLEGKNEFRTGIGIDSHAFDRTKTGLTLGGKLFKNYPKLKANSDGDVMLHALCNAVSQALGQGSLGTFANDLCLKKGIKDSQKYLEQILIKMHTKGFELHQVGFQFEGKFPLIDPLTPQIKSSLQKLLLLPGDKIGITATSGEELTAFGRGEGLQCLVIVLLRTLPPHPLGGHRPPPG